jgi:glutamyl-tRNA synthetase
MKKVRFAPSPTGHLHVGGARTALFNYLYAKNQQGSFVLRIEDTDVERSSSEMADEILAAMKWLGLEWDEGPFYQSQRFDKYRLAADRLLEEGHAYRCFCTPEEIELRLGEIQDGKRVNWMYDRKCHHLSPEEIQEKLDKNTPFALRFFVPEGKTYFKDRLHKEMAVDNGELDDFVIAKPDGSPTYHLSVVVDDSEMGITDVVRGDDHLSNTFKQVMLFKALGLKPPKFAHLPLILGPDKKKLSKRHGETSVLEFRNQGYLPEAVTTYLAQLSWVPGDDKKVFALDDMASRFALSKVSKNSPVFDYNKLNFLNSRAIQNRDSSQLLDLLLEDGAFAGDFSSVSREKMIAFIDLIKSRMKSLLDLKEKCYVYIKGNLDYDNDDFAKLPTDLDLKGLLEAFVPVLEAIDTFDSATVERELRGCADHLGAKAGDLIHPSRFALVSSTISPSIFDVFQFMGKEESLKRIQLFIEYLKEK